MMYTEERRKKLLEFIKRDDPTLVSSLDEVLYSASESGIWPDAVDSVSAEQAILIWKMVEKLRVEQFPDELRM